MLFRSGAWKTVSIMSVRVGGVWKTVTQGYVRVGSAWKLFYSYGVTPSIASPVTISQSTDAFTGLVTLTGTNYHWSNATSLTYKFEQSTDAGVTWSQLVSGSIANPAVSNTQTYSVSSGVVTNIDNLYRFSVTGVNSTYSTSYTSTSGSTTISGARDLTSITAGGTASSLTLIVSWTSPSPSYTGSYLVSSSTDGVSYSTLSETTSTYAYLFSAVPGTTYYFKVVPYTGGVYSGSVTGYAGNASTTSAPTVPSNAYNGVAFGDVSVRSTGPSAAVTEIGRAHV